MIIKHQTPNSKERLVEIRNNKLGQGLSYEGHLFQVDLDSHTAILNKAARVQLSPVNVLWRDSNNNMVEFTTEEFIAFAVAVDDYVQSVLQEQWT